MSQRKRSNENRNSSTAQSSIRFSGGRTVPVPASTDSFIVLESGELLPVGTSNSPIICGSVSGQSVRRRVSFGPEVSVDEIEREQEDDDEDGESPMDFDEEEMDESEDSDVLEDEENILDDLPSTSANGRPSHGTKRFKGLSASMKAALMSTETTNLLNDLKSAYQKKKKAKADQQSARTVTSTQEPASDDSESEEDETSFSDDEEGDNLEDPTDVDYYPSESERKASERKRVQPNKEVIQAKKHKKSLTEFQGKVADSHSKKPSTQIKEKPMKSPAKHKPTLSRLTRGFRIPIWSDDEDEEYKKTIRRTQKLPPEVESLLGQSIVSFSQGRREEALKLIEEVVVTHPGYYESYERLSMFHGEMGDKEKEFQFGLLAAHLNNSCPAERWAELATLSLNLNDTEQAIRCYTKAYRADPFAIEYYDAKINLLEQNLSNLAENDAARKPFLKQISDTKVSMVRSMLTNNRMSTDEYIQFAQSIFQDFYSNNDIRGSIVCLKCILERGNDRIMYDYLNNLMEIAMHAKDYEDALLVLLRYTKLQPFNNDGVINFKDEKFIDVLERRRQSRRLTAPCSEDFLITHYIVPEGFPVEIMGKTIACWIRLKRFDCCKTLLDMLKTEVSVPAAPDAYWQIAEALFESAYFGDAEKYLEQLVRTVEYEGSVSAWLYYAETLASQGRLQLAAGAFARVVQLSPHHVSARLSLSALQQLFGQEQEALQTLDIGDGRMLEPENMDERILHGRCVLLHQVGNWNHFIKTGRFLLAMYFKDVNWNSPANVATGIKYDGYRINSQLRMVVLDALRNSNWQRLIDRMPRFGKDSISSDDLWDIFMQLCELLYERRLYTDYFHICCLASQSPPFLRGSRVRTVLHLLLHSSILKRISKIAWTIIRYCMPAPSSNSSWNIYGLLFAFTQEVRFHKFTLRAMLKMPDNVGLAWFSGNNSLITGTYQHALAEYFYILQRRPNDPLLNLLIGICFFHLAAKKFIARRHDLCIQGLAFLSKYEELRGPCQEVYYNMGRAFHQIGVLYASVYYYKRALEMEPANVLDGDEGHKGVGGSIYDMRPLIAHNLALIYQNSNNPLLARNLLERYCTIE